MPKWSSANERRTMNAQDITPGTRVRLCHDIDRYPHFVAPKGAEGTVIDHGTGMFHVRMDEHIPGAEDWDNEVIWSVIDGDDPTEDVEVIS
jgi:hypothetical protein